MNGKILSLSLGLMLSLNSAQAATPAKLTPDNEGETSVSYWKPALYFGGGIAAVLGLYAFANRRPPAGGFVLGAAAGRAMQEAQQNPVPRLDVDRPAHAHHLGGPPVVSSEMFVPSPRGQSTQLSPRSLARLRVLVVEDEPIQELVTRRRLSAVGASVEVVRDAEAAVQAIQRSPREYDVVLMDNNMPLQAGGPAVQDAGLQATTRIRALSDPTHDRPPVIMHSSNSIPPSMLRMSGAVTEIVKGPSKTEDYVETILDVLEQKKEK